MKTTMNMMMAAALTCALAATASAQYSQPVKEVEKEARNGVTGYCESKWRVATAEMSICEIASVPAGKVLAIRWVSAFCHSKAGEASIAYGHFFNGSAQTIWFPLQSVSTPNGLGTRATKIVSAPVWMNAKPGTKVHFQFATTESPSAGSDQNCQVYYSGFLLDN